MHNKAVLEKMKGQECNYIASQAASLSRHMKSVHEKMQDYSYNQCQHKSSSVGNLRMHVKFIHVNTKDQECDRCEYKTRSKEDLK